MTRSEAESMTKGNNEARLQNPVLTNRNRILRRVSAEDEMARHIEVRILYRIAGYVDAAAIGGTEQSELMNTFENYKHNS